MAGCQDLAAFQLDSRTRYKFTDTCAEPRSDGANYRVLLQALEYIQVQGSERRELFNLIAALIHFGECEFLGSRDDDKYDLEFRGLDTHFKIACELVGMDCEKLFRSIAASVSTSGRGRKRLCIVREEKVCVCDVVGDINP